MRKNYEEIVHVIKDRLLSIGVIQDVSENIATSLAQTSLRGIDSHGINLLHHYINAFEGGRLNRNPNMKFVKSYFSTATLDADHSCGIHAGIEAMNYACRLALAHGLGAVSVKNSSHFAAASIYSLIAANRNMIGLSFTNADSLMKNSGSDKIYFGTNPICVAAPVEGEEPFCLDMATSKYNWNKLKNREKNGEYLPDDVAVGEFGEIVHDPKEAIGLLPIGDYKGFGLAMVVDILCALLSGMKTSNELSPMYDSPLDEKRDMGHFFVAIDISAFTDLTKFKSRLFDMFVDIRKSGSLVPGDPEKMRKKIRKDTGIPLLTEEWKNEFR